MNNLIDRQAVLDVLSKAQVKTCGTMANYVVLDITTVVANLPSAQPEIVRCGECSKMQVDNVFHDCWCSETKKKVWIDHYCGYAERRTDEQVQGL